MHQVIDSRATTDFPAERSSPMQDKCPSCDDDKQMLDTRIGASVSRASTGRKGRSIIAVSWVHRHRSLSDRTRADGSSRKQLQANAPSFVDGQNIVAAGGVGAMYVRLL